MPALSLYQLAQNAAAKNANDIFSVGDLPYEHVRPILLKLQNPDQLRKIEEASPQIRGEDGDLWLHFIKRDVQNWNKKPHQPSNPLNWAKVYRKLVREEEAERQSHEAALVAALNKHKEAKAANQSTFIQRAIDPTKHKTRRGPHLFTSDRRAVIGRDGKLLNTSAAAGNMGWGGATGAKNASIMDKLKRQTRDATAQRSAKPIGVRPQGTAIGQVRQAPNSTVTPSNLSRVSATTPQSVVRGPIRVPTSQKTQPVQTHATRHDSHGNSVKRAGDTDLVDREKRLRALTANSSPARLTSTAPKPADDSSRKETPSSTKNSVRREAGVIGRISPQTSPARAKRPREQHILVPSKRRKV